jgi:hypothetical protein
VFASVPFHAFFGVALMSGTNVIGGDFYRALALPWVPDPLQDQRLGGGLAWASGELPLLLVVIVLLIQWSRHDERSARRDDRRADHDGDADLRAYNAMLHRLSTGTGASVADSHVSESFPGHMQMNSDDRPDRSHGERDEELPGHGHDDAVRGGVPQDG